MPKIKKLKDNCENIPFLNQIVMKKRSKSAFKFDMKEVLKERLADNELWEKNAKLDKQMKIVDDLFQKKVIQTFASLNNNNSAISPTFGLAVFDRSKYNIQFNNIMDSSDSDTSNLYFQKLFKMSVEENELEANIYFIELIGVNWSPGLDDIIKVLCNWGADLNTLLHKPQLKSQINEIEKIGLHNFELVINFILQNIYQKNNKFSNSDLLTLAKFAVTISFDYYCGQMMYLLKKLFCVCIETAFPDDDIIAITEFSQKLYSQLEEDDLLKLVIDLFLPLEGKIMKMIYSYITFRLYKSFLGKTHNINAYPCGLNDWFVQDLVNKDYFKQNPKRILYLTVNLLEHIVIVFDLYQDEEKLNDMYEYLSAVVRSIELCNSMDTLNILAQWNLRLFRLYVNRLNVLD